MLPCLQYKQIGAVFFCLSVNSMRDYAATLSLKLRTLRFEILLQSSQRLGEKKSKIYTF